jgi:ribosomal protein S12 methylthiotransferase
VALVSLGCPKNLVDSERMLAGLALAGFAVTPDPDGADLAIVNTCAFIDLARAESDRHIDDLESLKTAGRLGRIVVAGCMAQRYRDAILARHPGVDAVVGIADRDALAGICHKILNISAAPVTRVPLAACPPVPSEQNTGGQAASGTPRSDVPGAAHSAIVQVSAPAPSAADDRERLRLTPRHYAYLRISEGCDNRCAYCAIPEIRGPLRSKPADRVLAEAEELAADGAHELILIGQDTTAYGRDLSSSVTLAGLLAELRQRVRVPWLRLMYAHPASFSAGVIEQLAAGLPVVPYVDLPLQHASDPILASMGRRVTRAAIEDLIGRLRTAVPDAAIRTSFIVGYPGETEDRFEELLGFVEKVRFDHVGVFLYSAEPGTPAAGLPDQVPADVARRRWDRLMARAEELAFAAARRHVGRTMTVLVDGADETGRLLARHAGQAPEVDSAVRLAAGTAEAGEMIEVRITASEGYDLVAEPVQANA